MIIIVDVSAVIEILMNKPRAYAYKLEIEKAETVVTPALFLSEIANVAWKYCMYGGYSHEESLSLAEDGIDIVDHYVPVEELWKEALREAVYNNHPVYDTLYVVCARRYNGVLLTTDNRLKELCDTLHVTYR